MPNKQERRDSNGIYCEEHVTQVATLAGLKSRMTMLIGLNATFGSTIVGILLSINATTNHLSVDIATLTSEMKTITERMEAVEKRLDWCEKEIRELNSKRRSPHR